MPFLRALDFVIRNRDGRYRIEVRGVLSSGKAVSSGIAPSRILRLWRFPMSSIQLHVLCPWKDRMLGGKHLTR